MRLRDPLKNPNNKLFWWTDILKGFFKSPPTEIRGVELSYRDRTLFRIIFFNSFRFKLNESDEDMELAIKEINLKVDENTLLDLKDNILDVIELAQEKQSEK